MDKSVRNTLIVDDVEKLNEASEILSYVNMVAVDLEGKLNKGILWLV